VYMCLARPYRRSTTRALYEEGVDRLRFVSRLQR
jgi:hypothetical protein